MKRLLNCYSSDMMRMNGEMLKQAILASEGRTVLTETVVAREPLLSDITNGELASAFGSDMILLNIFDCDHPFIGGIEECDNPVAKLQEYTGRPVGCNLEPVDLQAQMLETRLEIPTGRQAIEHTYKKAEELGFNFICLTGNPGTGVSNSAIINAIKEAKKYFKGLIIAGKMHGAGVNEPVIDLEVIKAFIDAGAHVILMPAVNTVPGLSEETVTKACEYIHAHNALALTAIGTSQEGADKETIREIAVINKRCGADIQHIGDAGWDGVAIPENIMALSIAIRGRRWTYHRMASSIKR